MLLQECYNCGAMMNEDTQPVISMMVVENGKRTRKAFCQKCSEQINNNQNSSNLLLG